MANVRVDGGRMDKSSFTCGHVPYGDSEVAYLDTAMNKGWLGWLLHARNSHMWEVEAEEL